MTAHNDFNDDNDDVTTPPAGADAPGADHQEGSLNTGENTDADDASGLDADRAEGANQGDATENDTAVSGDPASDDDARAGKDDDSDADLPQLLREFSHVLRREFRSAAADSGFDPRDLGRLRRGRRRWDADEVVADGAAYPEEPVTYGPPRGRGGWGPSKNIDREELRQRFRDMRDGVGDRIEEVLTSEEFENLKASLSKIVENFGPEGCGDDSDGHDGPHDRRRPHDDDGHRGGSDRHEAHGPHGGRGDRDGRSSGGRGRRGFGPNFGPGFGPGRRGFDPFGWADERRSREQEVQEAFERGFAAGFEQGRSS
ncbi:MULTISPECIES: hypothetical protein [unclassified Brevibacterium]|uniref:hypothetical protein n=1 Tax=unclassified Brevibacterium TaxID=2614124 RepID=UPI0010920406|nr:hypothetical protein [Brevibacterium sp. S22]TGD31608.1 hypothetical protein EB835_07665 [Brevibacterium sp. S22]